jgi:hypothetical protein
MASENFVLPKTGFKLLNVKTFTNLVSRKK